MVIPKIIHHIAPTDKSRWHPIWDRCYQSWKEHFPDFDYRLWNDEEDINSFVKNYYPQYYDMFMEFPAHIMRIDFVRFCLLHYFGGIYSDMDMYCYQNFYDKLTHSLHIVEAPYGDEFLESSLMISEPGHQFWIDCMELSKEVFYSAAKKYEIKIPFNDNRAYQRLIIDTTGPGLVCRVWRRWIKSNSNELQSLPGVIYNNHGMSYHQDYLTKHLMTGMWGKESIAYLEDNINSSLEHHYITEMKRYADLNGVNLVSDLDFYRDYTNGGMKTHFVPDLSKNDVDNETTIQYG